MSQISRRGVVVHAMPTSVPLRFKCALLMHILLSFVFMIEESEISRSSAVAKLVEIRKIRMFDGLRKPSEKLMNIDHGFHLNMAAKAKALSRQGIRQIFYAPLLRIIHDNGDLPR